MISVNIRPPGSDSVPTPSNQKKQYCYPPPQNTATSHTCQTPPQKFWPACNGVKLQNWRRLNQFCFPEVLFWTQYVHYRNHDLLRTRFYFSYISMSCFTARPNHPCSENFRFFTLPNVLLLWLTLFLLWPPVTRANYNSRSNFESEPTTYKRGLLHENRRVRGRDLNK